MQVSLWLDRLGVELSDWVKSYRLRSDYFAPSDHLAVSLWMPDNVRNKLLDETILPKEYISFGLNGIELFRGNIDRRSIEDNGTIHIECNDYLAVLTDASIDYERVIIQDGQKLDAALLKILGAHGITKIQNGFNESRDYLTGVITFTGSPVIDVSSKKVSKYKAQPGDRVKQTIQRLIDRHGLMMLPTNDRTKVALTQPEYRQEPLFFVRRSTKPGDRNNVLTGSVSEDWSKIVTHVVANGTHSNPADSPQRIHVDRPVIGDNAIHTIGQSARAKKVAFGINGNKPSFFQGRLTAGQKSDADSIYIPWVFKDTTSTNQKELENFVKKELSERLRDIIVCNYTLKGHEQDGALYCYDTVFSVYDEIGRVFEDLWCVERSFTMSENEDQQTQVVLISPDSYLLGT